MIIKTLSRICAALCLGLMVTSPVHAQGAKAPSINDYYFDASLGAGIMTFSGSSNVASTYYGVDASLEVCRANIKGFDLCGGLNVFRTLSGASKTADFAGASLKTKTDLTTIGGFIKARKQVGQLGIAPYAGLRRIFTDTRVSSLGTASLDDDASAAFAGLEIDHGLGGGSMRVSLKAEVGRTFGAETNRTTFLVAPSLKLRF